MEETLGKRIVGHRKRLALTQDQLAEKLGVTAQAVSKWENDISCPDINMLPRLAEVFGTTTDALLGHTPVYETEVVNEEKPRWEFHHNGQQKAYVSGSAKSKDGWEFHWDVGRRHGLTTALFVLLVGGLLLASRVLNWDVGLWSIAWPAALLVFGLGALLNQFNFTNLICSLLGAYFLADNLGILPAPFDKNLIFPALIVIFGLSLLADALRRPKKNRFHIHKNGDVNRKTTKHFTQEGEHFVASLSFGEVAHTITLPRLCGGDVSVSFGEMNIDLTGCQEIADGCRIDVGVSFGEITLQVPRAYRVEIAAGASFGEIETHGHFDENFKGTIYLDGGVSFGELDIHYV